MRHSVVNGKSTIIGQKEYHFCRSGSDVQTRVQTRVWIWTWISILLHFQIQIQIQNGRCRHPPTGGPRVTGFKNKKTFISCYSEVMNSFCPFLITWTAPPWVIHNECYSMVIHTYTGTHVHTQLFTHPSGFGFKFKFRIRNCNTLSLFRFRFRFIFKFRFWVWTSDPAVGIL
jgi:hypothetical protein